MQHFSNNNFYWLRKLYKLYSQINLKEVVERYKGQGEKSERLEQDKVDAVEKIAKLKDEKENLMKKFEEMKYSGEQKMSEYVIVYDIF